MGCLLHDVKSQGRLPRGEARKVDQQQTCQELFPGYAGHLGNATQNCGEISLPNTVWHCRVWLLTRPKFKTWSKRASEWWNQQFHVTTLEWMPRTTTTGDIYIYIISLNVSRSYKFSLCDAMLILESQLVSAKFEATTFTHEYQDICQGMPKGR